MIFITLQEVIEEHTEIIRNYGGLDGIRDIGLLISAIEMPKAAMFKKYLHLTIFDKAAAYLFHIICNHPFIDGNKRTGTSTALTFLELNHIHIELTKEFLLALEELVVHTAESKITKKQVADFLKDSYNNQKTIKSRKSKKHP
ncbi:MAG: type II toxin-antitoxin system death-on-curing family toxin [Candidatus Rhabdochlamydia sp.]